MLSIPCSSLCLILQTGRCCGQEGSGMAEGGFSFSLSSQNGTLLLAHESQNICFIKQAAICAYKHIRHEMTVKTSNSY